MTIGGAVVETVVGFARLGVGDEVQGAGHAVPERESPGGADDKTACPARPECRHRYVLPYGFAPPRGRPVAIDARLPDVDAVQGLLLRNPYSIGW